MYWITMKKLKAKRWDYLRIVFVFQEAVFASAATHWHHMVTFLGELAADTCVVCWVVMDMD
jgi:hypothetical protein